MALKRRLRFTNLVHLFIFNPIGTENLIVLQHLGRNFLTKKFADFLGGMFFWRGSILFGDVLKLDRKVRETTSIIVSHICL